MVRYYVDITHVSTHTRKRKTYKNEAPTQFKNLLLFVCFALFHFALWFMFRLLALFSFSTIDININHHQTILIDERADFVYYRSIEMQQYRILEWAISIRCLALIGMSERERDRVKSMHIKWIEGPWLYAAIKIKNSEFIFYFFFVGLAWICSFLSSHGNVDAVVVFLVCVLVEREREK